MNNITFAIVAIMAAASLLTGAIIIAPAAYASSDGNTVTKLKNKGTAIASGFGTTAANIQLNALCFETPGCIGGAVGAPGG